MVKKTPDEWCQETGIIVRDPDGWDRRNFSEDWAIPLTWEEFVTKAMFSTIEDRRNALFQGY